MLKILKINFEKERRTVILIYVLFSDFDHFGNLIVELELNIYYYVLVCNIYM